MLFYSTQHQCKEVSFLEAVYHGFAPDGGLYLPSSLPFFSIEDIKAWKELSFQELSIRLGKILFPKLPIEEIIAEAFSFPLPLISFSENRYLLELFHGPTLSFKDVGARFLASLLRKVKKSNEEMIILVATSGDTGSAVGAAFYASLGFRVYILYPKGKVTPSQQKQLTTIGGNVTAIEVLGNFEDCQEMVKKASLDFDLKEQCIVTTANSINIGRIFPQAFYYFYAFLQLPNPDQVIFSVPCGNFGHLVSGILAKRMGLPIHRFVVATNINDEVPLFLCSGEFHPHPAYQTIAVSMDVGNPSNFPRLLELDQNSLDLLRKEIAAFSFTDDEIREGIRQFENDTGYLLDPHSSTAHLALLRYRSLTHQKNPAVFFATAHPGKFLETIQPLTDRPLSHPKEIEEAYLRESISIEIENKYSQFKEILAR